MFVKCIDNSNGNLSITIGVEYRVLDYNGYGYKIVNDLGKEQRYFDYRFEEVKEDVDKYVKCIDNLEGQLSLTIGDKYRLIDKSEHFYRVVNDCGHVGSYMKTYFEVVEKPILMTIKVPESIGKDGYLINGKRVVFGDMEEPSKGDNDPINPNHYKDGIECKDYIASHHLNFFVGNIIKYATRYMLKGNPIQDLEKVIQYAKFEIERLKKEGYN